MREFRLLILSTVAVILGIDIGVCITINPLISASLTGALLAIAAIIRAIGGPLANHQHSRTPQAAEMALLR
jgi:hypothetical protein